jgi:hypothetical protein
MTKLGLLDLCITLVNLSEKPNSIGVTFLVGGNIISGDLINSITYYEAIAKILESTTSDSDIDKANIVGASIKAAIDKARTPKQPQENSQKTERDEIYLKNLIIWTPDNLPISYGNGFIALRISAIDGFMLGIPSIESVGDE